MTTEERKWRFGVVKVLLDAEEHGLDEDGWVECRARLTARDLEAATGDGSMFAMLPGLLLNWSLKVDGEDVPFDRDIVLDLPVEILTTTFEELQTQPFFKRYLPPETTEQNSGGTTGK